MGFVCVEVDRAVAHPVALAGLGVDLQNEAVECVHIQVSIEMIFPRHSVKLLKPGHQCFGTGIGSPTRVLALVQSLLYKNTGDNILACVWKSVTSRKTKPNAERRRFTMTYGSILPY